MAPGLPNGQGKGGGAGAWAERWDKGEGGNGVGWGLGLRGARASVMAGILISPRNILRGIFMIIYVN